MKIVSVGFDTDEISEPNQPFEKWVLNQWNFLFLENEIKNIQIAPPNCDIISG